MEEKHGNVEKMFEPIKPNEPMPDIHFYLNWQCSKCGAKYGTQPIYCHGCGFNQLVQINPEYQSLMG
jgi:DNA-directed RNA polymerase subunit RPC12/RpoP